MAMNTDNGPGTRVNDVIEYRNTDDDTAENDAAERDTMLKPDEETNISAQGPSSNPQQETGDADRAQTTPRRRDVTASNPPSAFKFDISSNPPPGEMNEFQSRTSWVQRFMDLSLLTFLVTNLVTLLANRKDVEDRLLFWILVVVYVLAIIFTMAASILLLIVYHLQKDHREDLERQRQASAGSETGLLPRGEHRADTLCTRQILLYAAHLLIMFQLVLSVIAAAFSTSIMSHLELPPTTPTLTVPDKFSGVEQP